jgi:hypothetical protein
MNLSKAYHTGISWVRPRHAWVVPALMLFISHLLYANSGLIGAMFSALLSSGALTYYHRYNPKYVQVI